MSKYQKVIIASEVDRENKMGIKKPGHAAQIERFLLKVFKNPPLPVGNNIGDPIPVIVGNQLIEVDFALAFEAVKKEKTEKRLGRLASLLKISNMEILRKIAVSLKLFFSRLFKKSKKKLGLSYWTRDDFKRTRRTSIDGVHFSIGDKRHERWVKDVTEDETVESRFNVIKTILWLMCWEYKVMYEVHLYLVIKTLRHHYAYVHNLKWGSTTFYARCVCPFQNGGIRWKFSPRDIPLLLDAMGRQKSDGTYANHVYESIWAWPYCRVFPSPCQLLQSDEDEE